MSERSITSTVPGVLRGAAACTLVAVLVGGCAGLGPRSAVGDEVFQAIKLQTVADASRVTVREAGGIVTLSGFVSDVSDEKRLVAQAAAVEGVTRVRSNISVLTD